MFKGRDYIRGGSKGNLRVLIDTQTTYDSRPELKCAAIIPVRAWGNKPRLLGRVFTTEFCMPLFNYSGTDPNGRQIRAVIEASSLQEVVNKLRSDNLIILDITEVEKTPGSGNIKEVDLVVFSRQLASLVSSGIPLVKSLDILGQHTDKKAFKKIIFSVKKSIESGNSLADSFSKYPKIFSPLFINMVSVGEFSGNLDVMLDRLSLYLESYHTLMTKIKSAMVYPMAIVVVAVVILTVVFTFVIPGFRSIFESLQVELPLPTRIFLKLSGFAVSYFWWILVSLLFMFILTVRFIKTPRGLEIIDSVRSKSPVIGKIYKKIVMTRFTKTLATLVKSGVPILNSLVIAARTSGSRKLEINMDSMRDQVAQGKKVAEAMKDSRFFPSMVVSMVGVGEEGGDLGGMLGKVSDLYEREIDASVSGLVSLLEPAIIIFLAVVIGGIVISLFLPVLKITQVIGK